MESDIFREKSIKRVSSPEQLNDYVKVSAPVVWLVLIGIAVLLIGVFVWGIFGHLETVGEADGVCEGDVVACYVTADDANRLSVGDSVSIAGQEYQIEEIGTIEKVSGVSVCRLVISADLPEGNYIVRIPVERIHPVSFVIN